MTHDFTVAGRESALASAFFCSLPDEPIRATEFERRTLLERVIWKFKPDNTYCHLDGFDADQFLIADRGFVLVGRVWHLPERGTPGDIAAIMAVRFNQRQNCVEHARIWIGPLFAARAKAPVVNIGDAGDFLTEWPRLDPEWVLAFERDRHGWYMEPGFDLDVFLMPLSDDEL